MTASPLAVVADAVSLRSPILDFDADALLVVAHRGSWVEAPENSLLAIRDAVRLGVGMVEIDTRRAADGAFMVIHDRTLDRTTEATGPVDALDGAAMGRLRLRRSGGGKTMPLTEERVPTLFEALEEARGRVLVNIDTKSVAELPAVAREVLRGGFGAGVLVKAELSPDDLGKLPADHPAFGPLPFMPVIRSAKGRFAADLSALGPLRPFMIEACPYDVDDLEAGMEVVRDMGTRLWINTLDVAHMTHFNDAAARLDADAVWGRLMDLGVRAIQTDESEALTAYLAERGCASARL